eukprot:CAMPEP_0184674326 /NCGR_PEP_ID=MMETSP0308-20130426/87175_1 /TAXON_ID=38269 /ORGANISM="Gloeochaete witrockiana, Strain SAG 46.84" /LENGTH=112 /DNA_ID=CAMNT_0027121915 /DNA_START=417 /DNA_END=756 /DNA_ORIENTATION=+
MAEWLGQVHTRVPASVLPTPAEEDNGLHSLDGISRPQENGAPLTPKTEGRAELRAGTGMMAEWLGQVHTRVPASVLPTPAEEDNGLHSLDGISRPQENGAPLTPKTEGRAGL